MITLEPARDFPDRGIAIHAGCRACNDWQNEESHFGYWLKVNARKTIPIQRKVPEKL
jgi:hypothetical protein